MAVALAQEGSFGFGLQAEKGTFASPTTWLPLMQMRGDANADGLQMRKNYTLFDLADMNDYESRYYSAGEWVEGEVAIPFIPGALTNLLSWLQDRDVNNQGKWASVVVDCVNEVKQLTDVKIRKATIDMVKTTMPSWVNPSGKGNCSIITPMSMAMKNHFLCQK